MKEKCSECHRELYYLDRLSNGDFVCMSCVYIEGFKPSNDCIYNSRDFDITDKEMRVELTRISQFDINTSDKELCETTVIIPVDLHKPLEKLMKEHGSTVNAEIVAALSWYSSLSYPIGIIKMDSNTESILSQAPEEIKLERALLTDPQSDIQDAYTDSSKDQESEPLI